MQLIRVWSQNNTKVVIITSLCWRSFESFTFTFEFIVLGVGPPCGGPTRVWRNLKENNQNTSARANSS